MTVERWAAQAYEECSRDFAQTGYRGIGVRLLDDRGNWVTNVDFDIQTWRTLGTEEARRQHCTEAILAAIDRAKEPIPSEKEPPK